MVFDSRSPRVELDASTCGASAVTSTFSDIAPTVRAKFTATSEPTVTSMPLRTSVLKPEVETLSSYDPAGDARDSISAVVVCSSFTNCSGIQAARRNLGLANHGPCWSWTTPKMFPFTSGAKWCGPKLHRSQLTQTDEDPPTKNIAHKYSFPIVLNRTNDNPKF